MKLEALLNQHYESLTDNDKQILSYITKHKAAAAEHSSEAMAAACHVSRTTLLRFCQRLQLKSFAELKYLLKMELQQEVSGGEGDMDVIYDSYHRIVDELKAYDYQDACKLISQAETVYIYGTGNAQKAEAAACKLMFLSVGKCVVDLYDEGEIAFMTERFLDTDLFIILSLSGETQAGVNILKRIKPTGVQMLSITRFDNNTMARMCDHNLYVETKMAHGYKNLNYEITAPFYVLLDMLYVHYLQYIGGGKP